MVYEMFEILNSPLFSLYSLFFNDYFVGLYDFFLFKNDAICVSLANVVFAFIVSELMLVMYSFCSSMIADKMCKIKQTARETINEYNCGLIPPLSQNVLLCLRRIETEKTIHISVYGTFRLTKSFILSAIGIIFTYDLLIINAFLV